ncbi:hypothetical protein FRB91_000903 [Serendipita sp. 411]|nr:hypothetical protein FRC15_002918 [Serendipita sp. 397]KAG8843358.1 hypothetical protein FRC20_003988 [Serendipita sp. 405]KAG8846335.1 hypothetical protein FRB91_000903 [Serendipita sp. 411]
MINVDEDVRDGREQVANPTQQPGKTVYSMKYIREDHNNYRSIGASRNIIPTTLLSTD